MVKFEDVKEETTEEHFNGNQFSIDAFNTKYRQSDSETFVIALKRVCDYIASCEKTTELAKYWTERWFDEIYNDMWHPAGSIMQGANSDKKISLSNCTTIKQPSDSLESIFRYTGYRIAKTAAYRQGLGSDFSTLRPRGSRINNSSNESQGAVHWMKLYDYIAIFVGQKGRIPAFLFSLSCKHPDVREFIKSKLDHRSIQNANLSVQCTDDFYEAVESNSEWELRFDIPEIKKGQKIYLDGAYDEPRFFTGHDDIGYYRIADKDVAGEVIIKKDNAREILELIAKCMFESADPGIQNIDIARKYSNSDAVGYPIVSTNACCVVDETIVYTDKGRISIKDIYDRMADGEKFLALSYNIDSNKYEFKEILNSYQQRNDSTVELEIEENGKIYNIECSSDHPILTKNRGYVEAISLTSDDDIIIYK